jgi:hypothetical protein
MRVTLKVTLISSMQITMRFTNEVSLIVTTSYVNVIEVALPGTLDIFPNYVQ